MTRNADRKRDVLERDLAEIEVNLRILLEAELEAQHELDPHAPRVAECPVCRRFAGGLEA